jgi:hypothetical protein
MTLITNRGRWLSSEITFDSMPNWPCPTCGIGELQVTKEWAIVRQNSESQKKPRGYFNYNLDVEVLHFTGFLYCSNSNCKEPIAVCGEAGHRKEFKNRIRDVKYYLPNFFYPTLQIFRITERCPKPVSDCIQNSFNHYWNDTSAAANALRRSLEFLLDYLGLPNKGILSQRLKGYQQADPQMVTRLSAIRIFGNAGSHKDTISKEELLDAYTVYEACLNELFVTDSQSQIDDLASKLSSNQKSQKKNS